MSSANPGARAVEKLEIDDVFMIEALCEIDHDINPLEEQVEVTSFHRLVVEDQVVEQVRTTDPEGGSDIPFYRFFATGEVLILKKGVIPKEELPTKEELLARLKLGFAADYRCNEGEALSEEEMSAFRRNVAFNVWSYWREAVHNCCARMRLPKVTIPMYKPQGKTVKQVSSDVGDTPSTGRE